MCKNFLQFFYSCNYLIFKKLRASGRFCKKKAIVPTVYILYMDIYNERVSIYCFIYFYNLYKILIIS